MTIVTNPYACSVCTKRRDSDVNHWWLTFETEVHGHLSLVLIPWCEAIALSPGKDHLCGQTCLLKFCERWLAKFQEAIDEARKTALIEVPVPEAKH